MKMIFQSSCFHSLRNIQSFVFLKNQEKEKTMKMKITNKNVSQLPLVNKSILSQGYVVSSVFVVLLAVHIQFKRNTIQALIWRVYQGKMLFY